MHEQAQQEFSQKLKIALIVDSHISSKYVYDLACWAKKQKRIEISSLIIQNIELINFLKLVKAFQIFMRL